MADLPEWVEPGATATLIWHDGVVPGPGGLARYQVAGPLLEKPPGSPYLLLAPAAEGAFSDRLYSGRATLDDLRRFLSRCALAHGRVDPSLETAVTGAETPVLPLLDAWRALGQRPVLPYFADISAFLPRDLPVHVAAEAHAAAIERAETFERAWVCAECGDPEDMSVFLWTAHAGSRVRVCFLIENEGGRWTCHLHPFEFEREPLDAAGEARDATAPPPPAVTPAPGGRAV
jgi:hypothetical protein